MVSARLQGWLSAKAHISFLKWYHHPAMYDLGIKVLIWTRGTLCSQLYSKGR